VASRLKSPNAESCKSETCETAKTKHHSPAALGAAVESPVTDRSRIGQLTERRAANGPTSNRVSRLEERLLEFRFVTVVAKGLQKAIL
jgi:hypothetical protein